MLRSPDHAASSEHEIEVEEKREGLDCGAARDVNRPGFSLDTQFSANNAALVQQIAL